GQETERRKRRFRLPFTTLHALASLLALFLLGFLGFALFTNNPLGGEPVAQIAIHQKAAGGPASAEASSVQEHGEKPAHQQAGHGGEQKTVTIIDGSSGKRQDVVIGGGVPPDKSGGEHAPPPAA